MNIPDSKCIVLLNSLKHRVNCTCPSMADVVFLLLLRSVNLRINLAIQGKGYHPGIGLVSRGLLTRRGMSQSYIEVQTTYIL